MDTSLVLNSPSSSPSGHRRFSSEPPIVMSREDAARINAKIEDEIKVDAARRKDEQKRQVKVMLLGQAESGKSTLQKQFQLHYASKTFDTERISWIPIVHFNIIKAIRMIFAEIDHEISLGVPNEPLSSLEVQEDLNSLRSRLLPFLSMEITLASELSGGISFSGGRTGAYVRSGWQSLIAMNWGFGTADKKSEVDSRIREITNLVARTLTAVADDIDALWMHDAIKFYTQRRKIRLDDSASFFLRHIQRIAEPEYSPTNDDILHVRLQTLGVMEHTFPIALSGKTYDWKLYDVGGARGQRHAWIPYFDDASAIIFLAPISAFDQYLEEDPKMNRIDDSLQLFSAICSNPLLKNAFLIVLLNKTDILREKLDSGSEVKKYITSFGDRPNNFETVSDYFRSHFLQVNRRKGIPNRTIFFHFTSMLDTTAMQSIITSMAESIMRKYIAEAGLVM